MNSKRKYRIFDEKTGQYVPDDKIIVAPDGKLFLRDMKIPRISTGKPMAGSISFVNDTGRYIVERAIQKTDINGEGIFLGDVIVVDCYPFYDEGLLNYVGLVVEENDVVYYNLHRVSTRVKGGASGGHIEELEGIRVLGQYRNDDKLLECKEETDE